MKFQGFYIFIVCLFFFTCGNNNKEETISIEKPNDTTHFSALQDSLKTFICLSDSIILDFKKLTRLEEQLQKASFSRDTLSLLRKKLDNFWANSYFFIVEKEMQDLDEIGFDFNDYLNKLNYIENNIYTAYTQYPNTVAGLKLKEIALGFSAYKKQCINKSDELAVFLNVVASKKIKTQAEIDLILSFITEAFVSPFSEKINFHLNTFYLNEKITSYYKTNFPKISKYNIFENELIGLKEKFPVNDSIFNIAERIIDNSELKRKEILDIEIKREISLIKSEAEKLVKKNCYFPTSCTINKIVFSPIIDLENLKFSQYYTSNFNLLGENCIENNEIINCKFSINTNPSLKKGFSYKLQAN